MILESIDKHVFAKRPMSALLKDIVSGGGGLGFKSRAGQIGHTDAQALSRGVGSRHLLMLRCNIASIIKILIDLL